MVQTVRCGARRGCMTETSAARPLLRDAEACATYVNMLLHCYMAFMMHSRSFPSCARQSVGMAGRSPPRVPIVQAKQTTRKYATRVIAHAHARGRNDGRQDCKNGAVTCPGIRAHAPDAERLHMSQSNCIQYICVTCLDTVWSAAASQGSRMVAHRCTRAEPPRKTPRKQQRRTSGTSLRLIAAIDLQPCAPLVCAWPRRNTFHDTSSCRCSIR